MISEEQKIVLKDGTQAVLRTPRREDAENVLNLVKTSLQETDFLLNTPEEFDMTIEQEADFLENLAASDFNLMITCFIDGAAVGNCALFFMNKLKERHRARIAIAVMKKAWNKGIGTALFEKMIRIAKEKELMQLELEYIEGNERARHLYEKMGFIQFAERPNAIRLKDGTLLSEYLMIRQL